MTSIHRISETWILESPSLRLSSCLWQCFSCLIDGITGFQHCRLTSSTEFMIAVFLVPVPVSSIHFCSFVVVLSYSSQLKYLEDISSVIYEKYFLWVLVFWLTVYYWLLEVHHHVHRSAVVEVVPVSTNPNNMEVIKTKDNTATIAAVPTRFYISLNAIQS